jgi:hypothetical protein
VDFSRIEAFCTACWKIFHGEIWVHIEHTSVVPSLKKKKKWKKGILLLFIQDRVDHVCARAFSTGVGRGEQAEGRKEAMLLRVAC